MLSIIGAGMGVVSVCLTLSTLRPDPVSNLQTWSPTWRELFATSLVMFYVSEFGFTYDATC